jgi:hypothetical protein
MISTSRSEPTGRLPKVKILIDTKLSHPLKPQLYGFNTNNSQGVYSFRDKEFGEKTLNLKPKWLRFPGGRLSNYYQWKKNALDCYDPYLRVRNKQCTDASNLLKKRREKNGLDFHGYLDFCKKHGISALIVVNVYTGDPKDSAKWVKEVKKNNVDVIGWELGNELYAATYKSKYPNVSKYIADAKKHAAAMKEIDPNIKLGVPIPNLGFNRNLPINPKGKGWEWFDKLSKEDFYDAYVVHSYIRPYLNNVIDPKISIEEKAPDIFAWSNLSMKNAGIHYPKYLHNKELWLSEWNISERIPEDEIQKDYSIPDTLLHALYIGDFYLGIMNLGLISIAGHNVLCEGNWNGFPVFDATTRNGGKANRKGHAIKSVNRASYYTFNLIGEVMQNANRRFDVEIEGVTSFPPDVLNITNKEIPMISIACVSSDIYPNYYILITNKSEKKIELETWIDGDKNITPWSYKYVNAIDNVGNKLEARGGTEEIMIREDKLNQNTRFIQPLSFGYISF